MTSASAIFGDANNLTMFNLSARNREAEKIIKDYATGHVKLDVAIGLAGLIPVPGAGTASLVAAIAAQSPLVYQPMSRKLAAVFCATPDDITNGMIKDTAVLGGKADIAVAFATDFMTEIAKELLPELGVGLALSAIPFVGGIAAAALDATVAATLTWRVGTMVAIYYHNGGSWINDRQTTYHRAKAMIGSLSPETENRVDLDDIPFENPEVMKKHMAFIESIVDTLRSITSDETMIRNTLVTKGIPINLIDLAMKNFA